MGVPFLDLGLIKVYCHVPNFWRFVDWEGRRRFQSSTWWGTNICGYLETLPQYAFLVVPSILSFIITVWTGVEGVTLVQALVHQCTSYQWVAVLSNKGKEKFRSVSLGKRSLTSARVWVLAVTHHGQWIPLAATPVSHTPLTVSCPCLTEEVQIKRRDWSNPVF